MYPLDTEVDLLTVNHYGVDMSSEDTSFMRMIRTFCNHINRDAGSSRTKRTASTSLTPVANRISNSLNSKVDTHVPTVIFINV